MCSINHDLKVIFIHTPKCGGLFVDKLLEKFYGFNMCYFTHENHKDFVKKDVMESTNPYGFLSITEKGVHSYFMSSKIHNDKMNMTEEKWKTYKKITVIRNPYDRFISALKYLYSQSFNGNKRDKDKSVNFEEYCENIVNVYKSGDFRCISGYDYFHLFIPQYQSLINLSGDLEIDYYIHFETLNRDLCNTLLDLGVPKLKHREVLMNDTKINKSDITDNYAKYYNNELIQFVNDLFCIDFDTFNFKKVNTVEELLIDSKSYYQSDDDFTRNNIDLLIELDSKNLINSFEDTDLFRNICSNTQPNEDQIENPNTNNIVLQNGIELDVNREQIMSQDKKHIPPNIIIKIFENLSKDLNKLKNENRLQYTDSSKRKIIIKHEDV